MFPNKGEENCSLIIGQLVVKEGGEQKKVTLHASGQDDRKVTIILMSVLTLN